MSRDKKFDCIDFKRKSQGRIYADIRNLTAEGEVAYFQGKVLAGPFAGLWAKIRRPAKNGGLRRARG